MRRGSRLLQLLSCVLGLALVAPATARAQAAPAVDVELFRLLTFWGFERLLITGSEPVPLRPRLSHEVVAKAQPDECFNGIGQPYPPLSFDAAGNPVCASATAPNAVPKTNQAYVWGLAESNGWLYFGTLTNTLCLVEQSYLEVTDPNLTPYWVCEFGQSVKRTDLRPPKLYRYNIATRSLEKLLPPGDPTVPTASTPTDPNYPAWLLSTTTGIRSAGSLNDVVLFAGASTRGGVNFFAYDGATGEFLAAKNLPYTDIRQWEEYRGVLYTAVGTRVATCGGRGGAVLRWTGTKSKVVDEVIKFEEVGDLDAPGAYIIGLGGRLYISSWPSSGKTGCKDTAGNPVKCCVDQNGQPADDPYRYAGIIRGPEIPTGGLTAANAGEWTKVFSYDQYDPDPIAAMSYGGGALRGYQGSLFWGTMHVPMSATNRATKMLDLDADGSGAVEQNESLGTVFGTHRAISIFRLLEPEDDPVDIDLLYGETYLPKYDAAAKRYTIAYDAAHMNKLGKEPLFGASGFGNFWNNYTWIMNVYDGRLYVGTMDWSQLARVGLATAIAPENVSMTPPDPTIVQALLGSNGMIEGADLYRFNWKYGKARGESFDGLGNFTNYGFRTVLNTDGKMFIGSANPMNLHPAGGWELIQLQSPPPEPDDPPVDTTACANLADGSPCDDGDKCTQTDVCNAGVCVGSNPVTCASANQCQSGGECDSATGLCLPVTQLANATECEDQNPCTTSDACQSGKCVAAPAADGTTCPGGVCKAGHCFPKDPDPEDPGTTDPGTTDPGTTDPEKPGTTPETPGSNPIPETPSTDSQDSGTSSSSSCGGCGVAGQGGTGLIGAALFGMLALARRRNRTAVK